MICCRWKMQDWETWYLSDSTLFQANHNINYQNQLYFIFVFIYTYIKVKLTEGEKEMASPWLSQTRPTDILFWLRKIEIAQIKNRAKHNSDQGTKWWQKPIRKSVNLLSILQPESAKLSPICLIFAKWRFQGKRERFSPFSLSFEVSDEEKC